MSGRPPAAPDLQDKLKALREAHENERLVYIAHWQRHSMDPALASLCGGIRTLSVVYASEVEVQATGLVLKRPGPAKAVVIGQDDILDIRIAAYGEQLSNQEMANMIGGGALNPPPASQPRDPRDETPDPVS